MHRRRSVRLERARKRRRIAAAVLVAIAASVGAWMMTTTSVFAIAAVHVEGASVVPEATVIRVSGLRVGQGALGADLDGAAARVRALEAVRDATVTRDGVSVHILVEERRPAMVVRDGSRTWVVDRDGLPLSGAPSRALPVVMLLGEPSSSEQPLVARAARGIHRLWNALSERDRGRAGGLELDADNTATFVLGGTSVRFGDLSQIERKLDAYRLVRRQVRSHGELIAVDVRSPARPAAIVR
jgi:cell division septal protein FtsQ